MNFEAFRYRFYRSMSFKVGMVATFFQRRLLNFIKISLS